MVLKLPSEEIDRISNCAEKVFDWIGHGNLVSGRINLGLLPDLRKLGENCFGFKGNKRSEEGNVLNNVVEKSSFELLSWVYCRVGSHSGGSLYGDRSR